MEARVFINGNDVSAYTKLTSTTINTELSNKASTCSFVLYNLPVTGGDTFSAELPMLLSGEMSIRNMLDVRIEDADTEAVLFGGFVTSVDQTPVLPSDCEYSLQCQGYLKMLDNFEVSLDYTSTVTDQEILEDIFAEYLPEFDTTGVEEILTFAEFKMDGSIREVLEALAGYSNAEFYVDGSKRLYYDDAEFDTTPFVLGGSGNVPFSNHRFSSDFSERANQIRCSGVDIATNLPFTIVADDEESQEQWGSVFPYTVSDPFPSEALATVYASAELDRRSQPKELGSLVIREDGIEPGQWITINDPNLKFNGRTFLVRQVSQKWLSHDLCEYSISYGSYREDLADMLLGVTKTANSANQPRASVIGSGSITGGMLADAVLSQLRHFGPALRPVVMLSSNPSLPDADFPPDSTIYNTTDEVFYKNDGGTWEATDGPVGSYLTYHVGAFNANTMIGAIVADQIGSVYAENLIGEINATTGDVVVNANSIVGTMPGTVTIQGGSIQALFNSGSSVSIHGSLLTNASVPGDAVISISGSKIQTLSVSGSALVNGTITDTKIGDMNVGKLTAGNVEFGGATTIGYNSDYKLSLQSNAVRIQASSGRYVQITSAGAQLQYDANTYANLGSSGLTIVKDGEKLAATANGIVLTSGGGHKIEVGDSGGNIKITQGSQTVTLNSSGITLASGSASTVLTSTGLQMSAGQIGIGDTNFSSSPVRISSSGISLIFSGGNFGMASGSGSWTYSNSSLFVNPSYAAISHSGGGSVYCWSTGIELTVPSGDTLKINTLTGLNGTRTVKDGSGNNQTVTITHGIITGWTT